MLSKIFSVPKYLSKSNALGQRFSSINQDTYSLGYGLHRVPAYSFSPAKSQTLSSEKLDGHQISVGGPQIQNVAQRTHSIIDLVYEAIGTVVEGSRQTWKDFKYLKSVRNSKTPDQLTAAEIKNIRAINQNFLKLIPFAFFIIVPLAEFLLPFYLVFLPNATPKSFMQPHQIASKKCSLIEKQKEASEVLHDLLKKKLIATGFDSKLNDIDSMIQVLLLNKKILESELHFNRLDSETLKRVCEFMKIDHFDGTNIITQLYFYTVNTPKYMLNIFRKIMKKPAYEWNHPFLTYKFKLNYFPFEYMKRALLLIHIRSNMKLLRAQNLSISRNGIEKINEEELREIALERGIRAQELPEVKRRLNSEWSVAIKELKNNEDLQFWYTVANYHK